MSEPAGIGQEVLFEIVDNAIAVIRLNRPERRNAVNQDVTQALGHLVRRIEDDKSIRVAILASSSPAFFCAGADLSVIAAGRKDDLATPEGGFAGLIDYPRTKPWIAAVAGPVLAGGFELCLACDMIVAAKTAVFGLPEVKRGLFAASGGAHRLGRVLPRNIAIELIVTGEPIDVVRASALGLVNAVVELDGLLEGALKIARSVAANAPLAVAESLRIARLANEQTDAELRTLSDQTADIIFASEDAKEGPRAFLEKRAPRWTGA